MKKIIIFLITILLLTPTQANAKTTTFYEGEYIDNIWQTKVTPDRITKYHQKARFFRESTTNQPAYCIEPFVMFDANNLYESTLTPDNLTKEQITRMKQLAYLGYNSENRKDNKWYAVTQLLIWQTAVPTGEYYFTQGLNGNKINIYQSLIDELNNDVEIYNKNPEFKNEYIITSKEKVEIIVNNPKNLVYKTENKYTKIKDNKITIENLPIGTHEITITKEDTSNNTPIVFYQSPNSQNVMTLGTIEPQEIKFKVKVLETEIKVKKLDYDNINIENKQASLEGTTFQLYDEKMNEIAKLKIDSTLSAKINNINFGTYYLKEIIPGKGYILDETLHKITINENTPKIELNIKNQMIKGILEVNKHYEENNKLFPEKNISFNIYNNKNELYKTITTNESGYANVKLPYGTYLIEQATTTEGYDYIEPFTINIKDTSTITYNLTNHIIKGKLEINKHYEENNELIPEKNITFNIYDNKKKLYQTITTNELGYANIELPYGTYFIEQATTTEGYDYIEPFTINIKDTSTITYNLTNHIIKGKLEINKYCEENNELIPEKNITFNIYDNKKELYQTITTNELGYANIELPYGTYFIEQATTTEGYDYIEPFTINIKDTSTLTYDLINYKINVPNTYIEDNNLFEEILINLIKGIINATKIYNYNYFYRKIINTNSI